MEIEKIAFLDILRSLTIAQVAKVIMFFITLISLSGYVTSVFQKHSYETEIVKVGKDLQACESKWDEVKPYVGIRGDYDLRKIIEPGVADTVPTGSTLIDNGIIAIREVDQMTYRKITLRDYRILIDHSPLDPTDEIFFDQTPLHLWAAADSYELKKEDKSFAAFPHIMMYHSCPN